MTTKSPQQIVTLVASGGTPVRLADGKGRPYPTTGYGALVFSNEATLYDTTLTGVRMSVEGVNFADATGSANAYTCVFDPLLTLRRGTPVSVGFPVTNTGPSVLNGIGIRRRDRSQLIGNELLGGAIVNLYFDGAYFLLDSTAPTTNVAAFAGTDTQSTITPAQFQALITPGWVGVAGAAIAFYADGTTSISLPIVSKKSYRIRQITDVGGFTAIRLWERPAVPITAQLAVRIDLGIHGETYGAHQADGQWTVTAGADALTYILTGCPYVAGSVFQIGHCYEVGSTMPDCAAELNRLLSYGYTSGGTTKLIAPPGGMYQQSAMIRLPSAVDFEGRGSSVSFIFLADKVDQPGFDPDGGDGVAHMIGSGSSPLSPALPNTIGTTLRGIMLMGNRTRQGYTKGQHAVDWGGDSDTSVPLTLVRMFDVFVCGSPGYGMSGGGKNIKVEFLIQDGGFWGSDGDGEDFKNRENLNTTVTNINMSFMYWALGGQGTNLSWANPYGNTPTSYLNLLTGTGSTNPINTYVGQSYASISVDVLTFVPWQTGSKQWQKPLLNSRPGERIQFAGIVDFNGVSIPDGSYDIIGYDPLDTSLLLFDLKGDVATSSGAGGGSAVSLFSATLSSGDRIVDMRGLNFKAINCSAIGWYYGRTGFNQRYGSGANNAQLGGVMCVVDGCSGFDTSPDWIADLADLPNSKCRGFINFNGNGGRATNNSFVTQTGGKGIDLANTASNAYMSGNIMKGCDIGMSVGGSNHTFIGNNLINCVQKGIEENGGKITDARACPENPMTPISLTGIGVLLDFDGTAHGHLVGERVRFTGMVNASNGIVIRSYNTGDPYIVLTVPTPSTLTFDADGSPGATNLDPFGGDHVDAVFQGVNTPNMNNVYIGNRIVFEGGVTPGALWEYAIDVGNSSGEAVGLSQGASFSFTTIDAVVPINGQTRDNGVGTNWGPGNAPYTYVSNTMRIDVLEAPTIITRQSTGPLLGPGHAPYTVTKLTDRLVVTNLQWYSTLLLTGRGFTHDNAGNQNWGVELSTDNGATWISTGITRYACAGGSSRFLFSGSVSAATVVGFEMSIHNFNQPNILTYCMINGGSEGAATQLAGPGLILPSTLSFNALSIKASASNIQPGASLSIQGIPYGRP